MTYLPIIAEIKYIELIDKAEQENRKKSDGNYYEKHHITPKCFGGSNDKSNLVLLTAREHFEAHKLLCDMYQDDKKKYHQMLCAWNRMAHGNKKHFENEITADEYEDLRIKQSQSMKGKTPVNKGKRNKHTEEQNKTKSERMKGIRNHFYGKTHSEESKQLISESKKGKTNIKQRITCAKRRLEYNNYYRQCKFTRESDEAFLKEYYESLET